MSRFHALIAGTALVALAAGIASAQEKKAAAVPADTAKVKVSKEFLDRWKKINDLTKQKREFQAQKATTVAGVRGAEAEDAVLNQLYFKGGNRYPSRMELKTAIANLQETIKADPKSEGAAEAKYFIAQCYMQLGDKAEAQKYYEDVVQTHAASPLAKKAKEDLEQARKSK
jgi:TolA-binding protein